MSTQFKKGDYIYYFNLDNATIPAQVKKVNKIRITIEVDNKLINVLPSNCQLQSEWLKENEL